MQLLAHHELDGFGNVGEGMVIQLARDGRRVLWLAHESAPKNVTALDVTDPRKPSVILQTDLPHHDMRSNSLDLAGDLLVVAYQTKTVGLKPAGFEIFDVGDPDQPAVGRVLRRLRARTRGACTISGSSTAPTSTLPAAPPTSSRATRKTTSSIGSWTSASRRSRRRSGAGGCRARAKATPSRRRRGIRHSTPAFAPTTPTSTRSGRTARGSATSTAARSSSTSRDMAHPRLVSRWDYHPPFPGFTHTLLPLLSRGLLIVSDEAVQDEGKDWPKLVWVVDVRDETNPVPIATCPLPPVDEFKGRGGRYGAHNLHENRPAPGAWASETIVVGTFFNGGVRAFDLSDPFRPTEAAYYVPAPPARLPGRRGADQRRLRRRARHCLRRRSHHRWSLRARAHAVTLKSRSLH